MTAGDPVVVLSPHLDDAVFSCWDLLRSDRNVVVVTVFAGEPPPGICGPWDAQTGSTDSRVRVGERIAEDRAALGHAGRVGTHLPFLDEQYQPGEQDLADGLCRLVEPADAVYAPAGVAGPDGEPNFDHVRVRDAALALRDDVCFYADLPYAVASHFRLPDELEPLGLVRRPVDIPDDTLERKLAAAREYRSQLDGMKRGHGDFLGRHGLGRELYWER